MIHISDEMALALAKKVLSGEKYTPNEERHMLHIAICQDCFEFLQTVMAMIQVTEHIDMAMDEPAREQANPAAQEVSGPESLNAVIQVVILDMGAILQQMGSNNIWDFAAPSGAGTVRSGTRGTGGKDGEDPKLRDKDEPRTYVEYIAQEKQLHIQIEARDLKKAPLAYLEYPDGHREKIELVRGNRLYEARISGLEPGEYRLHLEKEDTAQA